MTSRMVRFLRVALGLSALLGCSEPELDLDTGLLRDSSGSRIVSVRVATVGDDYVNIVAGSACKSLLTFRNYPTWQFDNCVTCEGKDFGAGFLSVPASYELCGFAEGSDWRSHGACDAWLTNTDAFLTKTELSTSTEFRATVVITRPDGERVELRFRGRRHLLTAKPSPSLDEDWLCKDSSDDRLVRAVCCNWSRQWGHDLRGQWPSCAFDDLCSADIPSQ